MLDLVGMCCGTCHMGAHDLHVGGGGHHAVSDYIGLSYCVEEDPFPWWLRGFPACFTPGSTARAV